MTVLGLYGMQTVSQAFLDPSTDIGWLSKPRDSFFGVVPSLRSGQALRWNDHLIDAGSPIGSGLTDKKYSEAPAYLELETLVDRVLTGGFLALAFEAQRQARGVAAVQTQAPA